MNTITIICQPPNNNRNNPKKAIIIITMEICLFRNFVFSLPQFAFSLILHSFHQKSREQNKAGTSAVVVHYRIIHNTYNTNLYRLACITCAFLSFLFLFGIFTRVPFHSDFVFAHLWILIISCLRWMKKLLDRPAPLCHVV